MPDVGDDPFLGQSRPATVLDSRRLVSSVPAHPVVHQFNQPFAYGTAIVAVSRFRTPPVETKPVPPIH